MNLPATKSEALAQAIAETLNEPDKVQLYRSYCRKYPLNLIQRAFAEATQMPMASVRKSRAAIFFYLVKHYANQADNDISDRPRNPRDRSGGPA